MKKDTVVGLIGIVGIVAASAIVGVMTGKSNEPDESNRGDISDNSQVDDEVWDIVFRNQETGEEKYGGEAMRSYVDDMVEEWETCQ